MQLLSHQETLRQFGCLQQVFAGNWLYSVCSEIASNLASCNKLPERSKAFTLYYGLPSNQLLDGCLQKYWQPVASNLTKLPQSFLVYGGLVSHSGREMRAHNYYYY